MCDYSVDVVANRPAVVADKLIVTQFLPSHSRGFSGTGDQNTAVCLRLGTEIAFDHPVRYHHYPTNSVRTLKQKTAQFFKQDTEAECVHHDALRFGDGTVLVLNNLIPGQRATVLQLPVDAGAEKGSSKAEGWHAPVPNARELMDIHN